MKYKAIVYLGNKTSKSKATTGLSSHIVIIRDDPKPKGMGLTGWYMSSNGYIKRKDLEDQPSVFSYIDGYVSMPSTDGYEANIRSLNLALNLIGRYARDEGVTIEEVVVAGVSGYLTPVGAIETLNANDYKSKSGTVISNVELWRETYELVSHLKTTVRTTEDVETNPGLEKATALANLGVNVKGDDYLVSNYQGYWSRKGRALAMFGSHWCVYTNDHYEGDEYRLWTDTNSPPALHAFGSPLLTSSYAIVRPKVRDRLTDKVMAFHRSKNKHNHILKVRPMFLYATKAMQFLDDDRGKPAMWLDSSSRVAGPVAPSLSIPHHPVRMGRLGLDTLEKLSNDLDCFLTGKVDDVVITDISEEFYDVTTLKSGKQSFKLKDPGGDLNKFLEVEVGGKTYRLIYGVDIPPRNNLSRLLGDNFNAKLVVARSPNPVLIEQIYVIIDSDESLGIWTNPHSKRFSS